MTASASRVICMEYVIYGGIKRSAKRYKFIGRTSSRYEANVIVQELNQKGLNAYTLTYYPNGTTCGSYSYAAHV